MPNVELAPHQLEAIRKMHNGCILTGGVGTGKTRTALAYHYTKVGMGSLSINGHGDFRPMQRPIDLYVVTTAKKKEDGDWLGEASYFGLAPDRSSAFGGGTITVITWNSLPKYSEVEGASFVFDEQRLVGSGQWTKSFLKIAKKNQWILLSATPGDSWLDYIPVFIANGFYKNRTDFMRTHVVFKAYSKWPKVDHYVETQKLERQKRDIIVEMPYARHTVRHVRNIMVDHNNVQFDRVHKDRWHIYEDRPLKDVGEMFTVMRKLVNSDISRLGAVMELNEKHPKLIIFYNHDHELEALRQLQKCLDIPVAEWNGHKHEKIPEGDRWLYLVQYTAGAEGWNCIETDATIFFSLNYSYKITEQAKGRIDRLNTPFTDLYYYVLRSNSMIDNAIVRALAQKRSFNEKELM